MNTRRVFTVFLSATAVFGLACSSSSDGAAPDIFTVEDVTSTTTGDTAADAVSSDVPFAAADTSGGEKDTAVGPVAPTYCAENADCPSGYCVENECTDTCVSECAENYACKGVAVAGSDVQYICVPRFPKLCRPCLTDGDCAGQVAVGDDRCISLGTEGSFCGGDCTSTTCPGGYECKDFDGGLRQCVPTSGQCTCKPVWVAEQAKTTCSSANETGVCAGFRQCTPQGLSECDAPAATAEDCDGVDDDCDGQTDEDLQATPCMNQNGLGTCTGERTCSGGALVCSALVPTEDICDGQDNDCDGAADSGFPDSDGDGKADCLESDADDDSVPNEKDDCPTVPDPAQANFDQDAQGDLCDADDDNDLTPDTSDCAPLDPSIYPGATEACNGVDDDCDLAVDEGFVDTDGDGTADCLETDKDGDGVPDAVDVCPAIVDPDQANFDGDSLGDACDADDDGDGWVDSQDCAPLDATVHPQATELCDGKDQDCDAAIDEGFADTNLDGIPDCLALDDDGDGVPDATDTCPLVADPAQNDTDGDGLGDACDANDDGDLWPDDVDCAPLEATIYPGAKEVCDGVDQSCDKIVDEGFSDLDKDGVADCIDPDDDGDSVVDTEDNCPVTANSTQGDADKDGIGDACESDLDGDLDPDITDCQKTDPTVHHGAAELCNSIDDNCNGIADEGFADSDQDGVANCIDPDDDGDAVLDEIDVCPTVRDPGQADFDGDGKGDACDDDDDGDGSPDGVDCAPYDQAVHPGAVEACNGKDDDCDGARDEEGADGCAAFYLNEDGDGFGSLSVSRCLCGGAPPFTATSPGDCDDKNAQVFPGASESCNGRDDDCDGVIDGEGSFGCASAYVDGDADGYGAGLSICACPGSQGLASVGGDCNDSSPSVKPGQLEVCNGIDDDCDGQTDEEGALGCTSHFADKDGDGHGTAGQSKCLCFATASYPVTEGDDCDDSDAERFPGLLEVCDTKDNNCNGQVDEGVKLTFYVDNDTDGYGASYNTKEACSTPSGYAALGGDCNDFNGAIAPNKGEKCNAIDDDCDGQTDEGLPRVAVYVDLDGDAFGAKGTPGVQSCLYDLNGDGTPESAPNGYSTVATDCNDSAATVYPGALELCDGQLNNCSGKVADYHCPTVCPGNWPVPIGATVGFAAIGQIVSATNTYEVVVEGTGPIQVFSADGTELWSAAASISYSYPALADVNFDGAMDVVAFENNQVRVFNGQTGAVLETYNGANVSVTGARQGVVFDVDGDGFVDLIGGTNSSLTIILRAGGGVAKAIVKGIAPAGAYFAADVPAVVDIDGDGDAEVVVGTGYYTCNDPGIAACKGMLAIYDPTTGALVNDPTTSFLVPDVAMAYAGGPVPLIFDVDNDGVNELFHPFGRKTKPTAYMSWELPGGAAATASPGIGGGSRFAPVDSAGKLTTGALNAVAGGVADLDGDGVWEVISGGGNGVTITRAGTVMDGYPIATASDTPVIGDINRDGRLDILFVGTSNAELNCYTLGQSTYAPTRFLTNGHAESIGGQMYRTGSLDPFEPNDRRAQPFVAGPTATIAQARPMRVKGFVDRYNSSSGVIRELRGMVSTKGDRDFYLASGTRIRADVQTLMGPADLDLTVHVFKSGAYVKSFYAAGTGTDVVDCDWNNPCPELPAGVRDYLIEVHGKDPNKDYGPWPYVLTVYGAE